MRYRSRANFLNLELISGDCVDMYSSSGDRLINLDMFLNLQGSSMDILPVKTLVYYNILMERHHIYTWIIPIQCRLSLLDGSSNINFPSSFSFSLLCYIRGSDHYQLIMSTPTIMKNN